MKILEYIRWILFLPAGVLASLVVGALVNYATGLIGGSSWYVWLLSGAASGGALIGVAHVVAPIENRFSTWTPIIVTGLLGLTSALGGFLVASDWTTGFAGLAMVSVAVAARNMARRESLRRGESSQADTDDRSSAAGPFEAQELVNRYGAVLEHSNTTTHSESVLPASKEQIKDALVALARNTKSSGGSPEALKPLRVGYASLADFVSERDADAVITFDRLVEATRSKNRHRKAGASELEDAELRELVGKISGSSATALDLKRQFAEEFVRLAAEFDERVGE